MTPNNHIPPDALQKALSAVHASMGSKHPTWGPDVEAWEELEPNQFSDEMIARILESGMGVVLKSDLGRGGIMRAMDGYQFRFPGSDGWMWVGRMGAAIRNVRGSSP